MRKLAVLLIVALALTGCPAWAEATPGEIVSGYLSVVASLEDGSAGYSLKLAKAVCEVIGFAKTHGEDEDLSGKLSTAWDALGEERQARFTENFSEVALMADELFEHAEDVLPTFEDAGVGDDIAPLAKDEQAKLNWQALAEATRSIIDE